MSSRTIGDALTHKHGTGEHCYSAHDSNEHGRTEACFLNHNDDEIAKYTIEVEDCETIIPVNDYVRATG